MDKNESAARRIAAGQPKLSVNNGLVYLVPNGFDVMGYDSLGDLVATDGCVVRTIGSIGRVKGG